MNTSDQSVVWLPLSELIQFVEQQPLDDDEKLQISQYYINKVDDETGVMRRINLLQVSLALFDSKASANKYFL